MKHMQTCACIKSYLCPEHCSDGGLALLMENRRLAVKIGYETRPAAAAAPSDPFSAAKRACKEKSSIVEVMAQIVVSGPFPFEFIAHPATHLLLTTLGYNIDEGDIPHPTTIARHLKSELFPKHLTHVYEILRRDLGGKET